MTDRFLIYADLHMHSHGGDWRRVDDAAKVLEWIHNVAKEKDIKHVLFLGDFFHVRGYIYPSVMSKAYGILKNIREDGIRHSMLIGNHDMPYRGTTKHNSLTALGEVVDVIEQPMVLETPTRNFFWMPYVEHPEKANWALERIVAEKGDKPAVLLGHLDIVDAYYHANVKSTHGVSAKFLSENFELTLMGHYHKRQTMQGNVHYVGSPYQQNFGEADNEPGILIYDDGKLEWVTNDFSPKYKYITGEEVDASIEGHYVNITVDDPTILLDIRESAARFNPRAISVKLRRMDSQVERKRAKIESDSRDVTTLLREWVSKTANPTLYDHDKLLRYGMQFIKEV